jgi:hypothetical protein
MSKIKKNRKNPENQRRKTKNPRIEEFLKKIKKGEKTSFGKSSVKFLFFLRLKIISPGV